ncbi:ABC transporter permease subunit [Roseobacter sp. HKCCD9010]|nr:MULTISPECIES: ABC transporter permease [unclassified Roseobacter]MBF9052106.1 ABC transporter permease subunit [Rhodobacterales bacterium HKCCD4356]NNV14243.1 ABC transporter permease subunit [Roseobacter sp. HKCCD7357]NNV18627.1 ABC transporter permease subunit [Roseobacter sp. HKCCD8768]NNV28064.1 ABC transporter permease subunit [Roseobacter sp. HKCCD8192]NNV32357.1 ABC transporter permease subunit [Roseobacter sp. HKCCD9061]
MIERGDLTVAVLFRVAQALLTALAASVIVWAILPLAPGDVAERVLLGRGMQEPTSAEIKATREALGLNEPLIFQFITWLGGVFQGDLGQSFTSQAPVSQEIVDRLPATLMLLGLALVFSIAFSLILALIAAAYQDRWPDHLIRLYTQIGAALPTFVFALLALTFVVIGFQIGRVLADPSWSAALIPAFIIGLDRAASWTQLLRAGLLEAMSSGYAEVARARGASERRILLRHALPNAFLPFLTAIGISVGALIGGTPLIEAIFTWPGLGAYLLEALTSRNYPVIQGYVLIAALSYVAASLLVDVVAMVLDPRLRRQS